jgi:exodeoxyribonuclease VII small subunit
MAKRKGASARPSASRGTAAELPESFEATVAELRSIVDDLEAEEGDLATAVAQYERGVALQRHAEEQLEAARLRVEELLPDGSTTMLEDDEEDDDA